MCPNENVVYSCAESYDYVSFDLSSLSPLHLHLHLHVTEGSEGWGGGWGINFVAPTFRITPDTGYSIIG